MKIYLPHFTLSFGKHQGKTIEEITLEDPKYIVWCIVNLNHFMIDHSTVEELKKINPSFNISAEAEEKLASKKIEMQEDEKEYMDRDDDDWTEHHTYDDYNGSYAQDQMGWSDQDINDVFDGDADAYWNID
jgi:hypothetical protein